MTRLDRQNTVPKAGSDRFYNFSRNVIGLVAALLWKQEVIGLHNFPASGAYLVATNHLSVYDAPVVFIHAPARVRMFGADKWRSTPILGQFIEAVGVIWVNRGSADLEAIKAALGVLKSGGRLGVAPEGMRSLSGTLMEGKPGLAYMADRARVPIVPMAIWGTEKVASSWKRLRRPRVRCVVGEPFLLPSDGRAKGGRLDELTDLIMCRIAILLPPEYRGVYADHPLLREMLMNAPQIQQP